MVELTVRLVGSLAVVVGLLLLSVRLGARRFRPRHGAPVRIVHRQALSRTSSVAVVEIGSRRLVLGATEQQVSVLAELDEDDLPRPGEPATDSEVIDLDAARRSPLAISPAEILRRMEGTPGRRVATRPAPRTHAGHASSGPLGGSLLSPQTWRQALAVASGRG